MNKQKILMKQEVICLLVCYLFQHYRLCAYCHDFHPMQSESAWLTGKQYYQKRYLARMNLVINKLENILPQKTESADRIIKISKWVSWRYRVITHFCNRRLLQHIYRFIFRWKRDYYIPVGLIHEMLFLFKSVKYAYNDVHMEPANIPSLVYQQGDLLNKIDTLTFYWYIFETYAIEEFGHPNFLPLTTINELMLSFFMKSEEEILQNSW